MTLLKCHAGIVKRESLGDSFFCDAVFAYFFDVNGSKIL